MPNVALCPPNYFDVADHKNDHKNDQENDSENPRVTLSLPRGQEDPQSTE